MAKENTIKRSLPAYPLFVKDPYFSFWAKTEFLPQERPIFWTGTEKQLYGFIKTGGKLYCFMGNAEGVEQAEETDLAVTAFSTDYAFRAGGAEVKVRFVSPLPPDGLALLSCPVCYMELETAGEPCEVMLVFGQDICSNRNAPVRGGTVKMANFETAFFGLKQQLLFSEDNDCVGAEWGYWYLAGERARFVSGGELNALIGWAHANGEERFLFASTSARKDFLMFAFDDTASVDYFGDVLKGYYLSDHTIFEALEETYRSHDEIAERLTRFGEDLSARAEKFGEEYGNILTASLRQAVGAHKLVRDRNGKVLFLSKECGSNGCIATVDISYPSAPLFLLYNPELVRGMLRPVFKFAAMPAWKYDFAPHDVGTYPHCCGQVYGRRTDGDFASLFVLDGRETHYPIQDLPVSEDLFDADRMMPVEECANMLILTAACQKADGDKSLAEENLSTLRLWADYLVKHGLHPESQLCTDDFSGRLSNNVNLAVKAAVGIGSFAQILNAFNDPDAAWYRGKAEEYAGEIMRLAKEGPLPLTWDGDGAYSLKYNFAFDKILSLGLFPQELFEREVDSYLAWENDYGIPLDQRAAFTKSDWLLWTASLTEVPEKRRRLLGSVDRFLREGKTRLPFSDWYDSMTGSIFEFRNRAVQGGCFILLL